MNTNEASPEALRNRLIDAIVAERLAGLYDIRVEETMRAVPRHEHLPDHSIKDAYLNQAVTTKENPVEDALPLSSASQPDVVFFMLVQLAPRQGDKVFEAGAGTGYNAALLKYLVGPAGEVTTSDVYEDVSVRARKALDATGNTDVRVLIRDGALGASEYAPFDRIIATVGVWDIPSAWWDQLVPNDRLVLPYRWRGLTRSVAFVRERNRLRSDSVKLCGFLPMIGQDGEQEGHIDTDRLVKLYWDADQSIDPAALRDTIRRPAACVWTDATVGPQEPFVGVWLRLTASEPGTCRINVKPEAVTAGLRQPAPAALAPALVENGSLAYLTLEKIPGEEGAESTFKLGAVGYGPIGTDLAERLCEQIRAWDQERTAEPAISVYPVGTPDNELAEGYVIDKPSGRLVISF